MKNKSNTPLPFYAISMLCANISIVISFMYLTFHFIDNVNNAMGFLRSDVTHTLILILAVTSAFTAAAVLFILYKRNNKSYFFRKVAFITFWLCVFCTLIQFEVILPDAVSDVYAKLIWFSVSLFTIINSVFCNGLLVQSSAKTVDK